MKSTTQISNHTSCINAACPKSAECARYANYLKALDEAEVFEVLNPNRCHTDKQECQHLLHAHTELWAYGFCKLYATVPVGNLDALNLTSLFSSESTYFRTKRGDRPLNLTEQAAILEAIGRCGGNPSVGFDHYAEQTVYESA